MALMNCLFEMSFVCERKRPICSGHHEIECGIRIWTIWNVVKIWMKYWSEWERERKEDGFACCVFWHNTGTWYIMCALRMLNSWITIFIELRLCVCVCEIVFSKIENLTVSILNAILELLLIHQTLFQFYFLRFFYHWKRFIFIYTQNTKNACHQFRRSSDVIWQNFPRTSIQASLWQNYCELKIWNETVQV